LPRIYGVYQAPPSPGAPLCCALYLAFCVSDAAGTTSLWRPSVLCVSFLARQILPASGAPLCCMLPVVPFVRCRYHQFLVPICALCFFACVVGTTILWCPYVLYAAFRAQNVPRASDAPLCSMLLFVRGRYQQPLAPLCALCFFSCAAGTSLWRPSVWSIMYVYKILSAHSKHVFSWSGLTVYVLSLCVGSLPHQNELNAGNVRVS